MKTTALGILTIIVAVAGTGIKLLGGEAVDFATVITSVTAGIGLIKAHDAFK